MPEARLSAIASSAAKLRMIEMIPNEAKTVSWPISSGIAAATGERKTSSRTMISTGAAISSALWAPSVVASFSSLPIGASPEMCAVTGDVTRDSTKRMSGGTIVLLVSPFGIFTSRAMTALLGSGRSWRESLPALHGDRARVCGRSARSRASGGP